MLVNSMKRKKKTRQLTIGESFFLLWESSERIYLLPFSSASSELVRFSCKPHHRNTKYCGGIVEHDSLPWHVQRGSRADKWLAKSCDSGRWPIAAAARHDGAPHLALHRPFFLLPTFFWQCFKLLHPSAWRHFNIRVPCAREVAVCCGARL